MKTQGAEYRVPSKGNEQNLPWSTIPGKFVQAHGYSPAVAFHSPASRVPGAMNIIYVTNQTKEICLLVTVKHWAIIFTFIALITEAVCFP